MSKIADVICDKCFEEAKICLCQAHYDEALDKEYNRGKADGMEEA